MVERVPSPLSLQAVAQAMAIPLHSPRFASLWQQANEQGIDELGLYDNWLAWRGAIHQRLAEAYPYFAQFRERYAAFHAHFQLRQIGDNLFIRGEDPPWQDWRYGPMEAFLYEELQAFVQQPTAQAQERKAMLAALRDDDTCPASPEVIQRLQELCFAPSFIFPWCLSTAQFWSDVKKETHKEQTRLRVLRRHIQADPLLSNTLKERIQREVETSTDVFCHF